MTSSSVKPSSSYSLLELYFLMEEKSDKDKIATYMQEKKTHPPSKLSPTLKSWVLEYMRKLGLSGLAQKFFADKRSMLKQVWECSVEITKKQAVVILAFNMEPSDDNDDRMTSDDFQTDEEDRFNELVWYDNESTVPDSQKKLIVDFLTGLNETCMNEMMKKLEKDMQEFLRHAADTTFDYWLMTNLRMDWNDRQAFYIDEKYSQNTDAYLVSLLDCLGIRTFADQKSVKVSQHITIPGIAEPPGSFAGVGFACDFKVDKKMVLKVLQNMYNSGEHYTDFFKNFTVHFSIGGVDYDLVDITSGQLKIADQMENDD